jgi:SAM-dependent methyltransferase
MTMNQAQREQWNSDVQVRNWPKRERVTTVITAPLIAMLAPQPGERVLDIGSGGGLAAIEAARAVGATGGVTGFDISAGLVSLATRRAADAAVANVRFVSGDAQVDDMSGGPFDAAMSQLGVMFFADPVAAFRNIRRHLRPGGRMVFACWQSAAKNAWFPVPVMAKYAPAPPAPAAGGGPPPGPFAFGDVAYVRGILTRAGFGEVRHEVLEHEVVVPEESMYEREIFDAMRLDGPRAEEAWKDLMAFVAPMRVGDGQVRMRLAPQLFAARSEA